MEEHEPTIEMLREAVVTMTLVVNPLSTIAERILIPRRRGLLGFFGTDDDEHDRNPHQRPDKVSVSGGTSSAPERLASLAQW